MNEELKKEAIRKAWIAEIGQIAYEMVKDKIDADGVLDDFGRDFLRKHYQFDTKLKRRKSYGYVIESLQGVEDNNGWIRIEADGSNLPIVDIYQKFEVGKFIDNIFDFGKNCDAEELFNGFERGHITHYKPIIKSQPPHY